MKYGYPMISLAPIRSVHLVTKSHSITNHSKDFSIESSIYRDFYGFLWISHKFILGSINIRKFHGISMDFS